MSSSITHTLLVLLSLGIVIPLTLLAVMSPEIFLAVATLVLIALILFSTMWYFGLLLIYYRQYRF